jgi:hypothetical protein
LDSSGGCPRITFLPPHFWSALPPGRIQESVMGRLLVAAVIAGLFVSLQAKAQERAGSTALGAVSGAVVLGPVGALAGAFIGYAAGPAIARSWGVGHSASRARAHRVNEANVGAQAIANATPLPVAKPAAAVVAGRSTPPVQGFD